MTTDTSNDPAAVARVAKKTRRPRNRKAQILAVARDQFGRSGYHQVNMEDIASAVGITAGALYRHFPNKQEILAQVMLNTVSSISNSLDEVAPDDSVAICQTLIDYYVDNEFRAILIDRDSRHLTPERRGEVRSALNALIGRLADAVHVERPELGDGEIDLLARALLSVTLYPARHGALLPRKRLDALLRTVCVELLTAPVQAAEDVAPQESGTPGFTHASRRETLLLAAIRLFRERGYRAVTMDDIGIEAGTASSNIYTHFDSKSEVVQAILTRGNETLRMGLANALAEARSREEALALVVRSYVVSALAPTSAISILVEDATNIPDDIYASTRAAQREYIDEWVGLVGANTPETRTLVLATIGLINDLTRVRHLHRRSRYSDDITDLALRVLHAGAPGTA